MEKLHVNLLCLLGFLFQFKIYDLFSLPLVFIIALHTVFRFNSLCIQRICKYLKKKINKIESKNATTLPISCRCSIFFLTKKKGREENKKQSKQLTFIVAIVQAKDGKPK